MKTKLLFCAMLVIAVMSSCKKDYDVMSAFENLADKNIDGTFVYWDVDTLALKTTLYQYSLNKTSKAGIYYACTAGNHQALKIDSTKFVFSVGDFMEKNLFVDVLMTGDEMESKHVKWGNNAIYDGNMILNSSTDAYKMFGNLFPIVGNDDKWSMGDTAKYETIDTIFQDYMYWAGTKAQKNLTQDSIDKLYAFFAQQWVKDTIKWFNACLDPQVKTTITKIPDTIRYIATTNTYVVPQYSIKQKFSYIHHFVGYEHIYSCTLYLNNADNVNTCYYMLDTIENTREVFDDPASPKAVSREKHISLQSANWCISKVNYAKGFDLLLKGQYKYTEKINGKENSKETSDYIMPFVITNYNYTDKKKEMSLNDIPLKLINK